MNDYHGQLQRSKVKGGGPAGNNYRQMMIEKEMEYSKLLDDFQVRAQALTNYCVSFFRFIVDVQLF